MDNKQCKTDCECEMGHYHLVHMLYASVPHEIRTKGFHSLCSEADVLNRVVNEQGIRGAAQLRDYLQGTKFTTTRHDGKPLCSCRSCTHVMKMLGMENSIENYEGPDIAKIFEYDVFLIQQGCSFDDIRRYLAGALLALYQNGALRNALGDRLPNLVPHLHEAMSREMIDPADSNIKQLLSQLWEIVDNAYSWNQDLAYLAHCVIICYCTEEEWLTADSGDLIPIDTVVCYLDKVILESEALFCVLFGQLVRMNDNTRTKPSQRMSYVLREELKVAE